MLLFGGLLLFVAKGFPGFDGAREEVAAQAQTPGGLPVATAKRFDGPRALALVRRQVAVGQRPAGSPQLRKLAGELRGLLPRGRFEDLPGHPGLRNVIGTLPGRGPALVIGAHYDTESHPKGFVGANDSAAGTAALIEVGRALGRLERPRGARRIELVLFDGEEEPREEDNADFYAAALRGSKAYVKAHRAQTKALVLLDYIGNKGLRLPREGSSNEALWAELRAAARSAGVARVFPGGTGVPVFDDHTPFLRASIPAIDLIDFDYRYADGLEDTVDKLDVRALDAVGESVVELVRRLDRSGY